MPFRLTYRGLRSIAHCVYIMNVSRRLHPCEPEPPAQLHRLRQEEAKSQPENTPRQLRARMALLRRTIATRFQSIYKR